MKIKRIIKIFIISLCSTGVLATSTQFAHDMVLKEVQEILSTATSLYLRKSNNTDTKQERGTNYQKAKVVRIVDGDTLIVSYGNSEHTIRAIGIDTPESVNPDASKNSKAGKSASKYTKSLLKKGDTVYLEKDVSDVDRYGRELRYIWTKKVAKANYSNIRKYTLNGKLVYDGYAIAKPFKPDTKYKSFFSRIQKNAKKNKRGILWK